MCLRVSGTLGVGVCFEHRSDGSHVGSRILRDPFTLPLSPKRIYFFPGVTEQPRLGATLFQQWATLDHSGFQIEMQLVFRIPALAEPWFMW